MVEDEVRGCDLKWGLVPAMVMRFSLTSIHRGVGVAGSDCKLFQQFWGPPGKTVETVPRGSHHHYTQLKLGVNENIIQVDD
jgi:hypothetical protein